MRDGAEIVVTGSELVKGWVHDVNGPFLARHLTALGIRCRGIAAVGDDPDHLVAAIRGACDRSRLVVISGGLGPTGDDLTRAALERALDVGDACPIPNPKGSALGVWRVLETGAVAALPGVPWELVAMWPELARRVTALFGDRPGYHARILRTVGLSEREVEARIRPALGSDLGRGAVTYGVTAQPLAVDVHLGGASRDAVARAAEALGRALGGHYFGDGDVELAAVAGAALRGSGLRVAVAESCTGGALCAALAAVAGASDYLDRGVVSYANAAKVDILGVPEADLAVYGAVSDPVARAMATGILARSGARVALAVTGIAGPSGGTPDKPVGRVYMALADAHGTFCRPFDHPGDRARVIRRTVTRGLDLLRRYAVGGLEGVRRDFPRSSPE